MKGQLALLGVVMLCCVAASDDSCDASSSDRVQRQQNEQMLKEATAQTGMPAIKNFRERKLLKDILELRDQDGLATYTYVFSEQTAALKFFCNSIGYAIPYATQYTNPQKPLWAGYHDSTTIPQADPNGLFSPDNAEGSWVMCLDPEKKKARPVYIEPRVVVSPFALVP